MTVVIVSGLLYFGSRFKDRRPRSCKLTTAGLSYTYSDIVAGLCTWAASFLLSLLAWYELRSIGVAVAWAVGGALLLEIGYRLPIDFFAPTGLCRADIELRAHFLCKSERFRCTGRNQSTFLHGGPNRVGILLCVLAASVRGGRNPQGERRRAAPLSCYLGTVSIAALIRFELEADWVVTAWAALVFALCALPGGRDEDFPAPRVAA